MNHQETEITDVVVVLDELDDQQTRAAAEQLKLVGMIVETVDDENSVIEGTVEITKVQEIKKVQHVRYVRTVFSYTAETGEAAENDGDSDDCED
jgi:FlaA1/EpsC-like NDP-sugar epimerase